MTEYEDEDVAVEDETEEEEEDQEDRETPPPRTPPSGWSPPRSGNSPRRRRGQQRRRPAREGGPDSHPDMKDPFLQGPRGVDPFDFISPPVDTNEIRVERTRANGKNQETGFAGMVPRVIGFEKEVARRWGGGDYTCATVSDGDTIQRGIRISGDSKSLHEEPEEEQEEEVETEIEIEPTFGPRWTPFDHPRRSVFDRGYHQRRRSLRPYDDDYYGDNDPWETDPEPPHYPRRRHRPSRPWDRDRWGRDRDEPYFPPPAGPPPAGLAWDPRRGLYVHDSPQGHQEYGPQSHQIPGMQPTPVLPNIYKPIEKSEEEKKREEAEKKREEEIALLRQQIEAAREEARDAEDRAAQEREERRIEAERAMAREKEEKLQREMDRMKIESERKLELMQQESERRLEAMQQESRRQAELLQRQLESMQQQAQAQQQQFMQQISSDKSQGGSDMITKMMEMQMLQLQQQQHRTEQERLDREARWREESLLRKEEADKRDLEYKREREQQEAMRREEREREEVRRRDQEKHYQHLMTTMQSGQQTPEQMLSMLKTLVDLTPKQDATSQVMDLAHAAVAMREIIGGNQEQENKWESIIRTGGEAVSRAIGEIQAKRGLVPQQAPPGYPPQGVPIHQQLPGPAPMPQNPQVIQAPRPPQGIDRDPSAEEWGRILSFVVGAMEADNDAESTATHLYTMTTVGMQLPKAIDMLADSDLDQIEFQLSAIKLHPQVAASPFSERIDALRSHLQTSDGRGWLSEVLLNLRAIRDAAQGKFPHREEIQEEDYEPYPDSPPIAPRPRQELTPEEFAARSKGIEVTPAHSGQAQEVSAEEFSKNDRGDQPEPPSSEWDKTA